MPWSNKHRLNLEIDNKYEYSHYNPSRLPIFYFDVDIEGLSTHGDQLPFFQILNKYRAHGKGQDSKVSFQR